MTYTEAKAAKRLAESEAIPQWHPHLQNYKIAYLKVDRMTRLGVDVAARIRKASGLINHLSGFNVILELNEEMWDRLSPKQRLALLDHEFCHLKMSEDDSTLQVVAHDLEEFRAIVRRHGLWEPKVKRFAEQLALPMGEDENWDDEAPTTGGGAYNGAVAQSENGESPGAHLDTPQDDMPLDEERSDAQLQVV